jgi:hypothetical protein
MGALCVHFADSAMVAASASEMTPHSEPQHSAMRVMPLLMVLCAGSLFGAARTVAGDMHACAIGSTSG